MALAGPDALDEGKRLLKEQDPCLRVATRARQDAEASERTGHAALVAYLFEEGPRPLQARGGGRVVARCLLHYPQVDAGACEVCEVA
ncbi:MAG: hypothetical protein KatS3mg061_3490 [Dehalococcoidia bacterium]|nr:MAG: hypothetical protein KatS3mg061_3490 [Dehalococcoidia bacterium]